MAFENYLTSFKAHLMKHLKTVFTFNNTGALKADEVKKYVEELTGGSAIPIPTATYEWLSTIIQYVRDKDKVLVYDNTTGLWHYEDEDILLRNILTDFFTLIAREAREANDQIMAGYANYFFSAGRIAQLSNRIKTSIIFLVSKASETVERVENFRYFETTQGTRALLDMSKPKFNLKSVTLTETQPMHLQNIAPIPIHTLDEQPTLWLSLIEEYMLHDPVKIEYFHKVLAYLMSPYNYNQAYVYFIGGGRNGKGTVIKVLQDILGPSAIRMNADLLNANPPPSFKKDDALAATEGRSVYIFNELDERMVASTQNIKDLTEGGRDEFGNKIMTVIRPAYSRNYEVNICGIPLVIANSLLNFGEWSQLDPAFKRLVLVPFDFQIVKEDPTILNRLAQEYPKIQTWLYLNYFKYKGILIKNEPRPASFETLFNQYREDSDILGMFFSESIDVTGAAADAMLRSDLYRMYEKYCEVNGRKPIRNKGTNGFANLIEKQLRDTRIKVVNRSGSMYVVGIKRSTYFDKEVNNV